MSRIAREDHAPRLPEAPRLPPAMPRSGVSPQARLALRQLLGDNERELRDAFRNGADARALARVRAQAVEHVVVHVWRACVGDAPDTALFAVGGFGRGFLFPFSDVDLLVLIEPGSLPRHARMFEAFFACLWDLGLKPGHAVREPRECRELAARDVTVFTNLLDARRLAGSPALVDVLGTIVDDPALWPAADYLAAKRAEQSDRHARFNDTTYNLEPNLKDGPGGLRTLDLLRWLGRRITRAADFDAMVAQGLLDPTERAALDRSEATLRRYRYALHLAAGAPKNACCSTISVRSPPSSATATSTKRISPSSSSCRAITARQPLSSGSARRLPSASWNCSIRRLGHRAKSIVISSQSVRASSRARRRCSNGARARWSTRSRCCSIIPSCVVSPPKRCAGCSARWRGTRTDSRTIATCWHLSSRCCGAVRRR